MKGNNIQTERLGKDSMDLYKDVLQQQHWLICILLSVVKTGKVRESSPPRIRTKTWILLSTDWTYLFYYLHYDQILSSDLKVIIIRNSLSKRKKKFYLNKILENFWLKPHILKVVKFTFNTCSCTWIYECVIYWQCLKWCLYLEHHTWSLSFKWHIFRLYYREC